MHPHDRPVSSVFQIGLTAALVGLFLFLALLRGDPALVSLCLLVLALFAGTRLWARWGSRSITCRLEVEGHNRLFPGETVAVTITAENRKFLPMWLSVDVPVGSLGADEKNQPAVHGEGSVLWYQEARFAWALTAPRRGVYQIGPATVFSSDLFGFVSRRKELEDTLPVIVYPRIVQVGSLPVPRRDFFGIAGARNHVADPVYIVGTRDYQYGRPARHIHWKASARHRKLQEKVFEASGHEKVLFLVEVHGFAEHEARDEFERALEAVASLALRADRQGLATGLITNGLITGGKPGVVPATRSAEHVPTLLETLARLEMQPACDLATLLRSVTLPGGLSSVYMTLDGCEPSVALREHLRSRRIPVSVWVSRATDSNATDEGQVGGSAL